MGINRWLPCAAIMMVLSDWAAANAAEVSTTSTPRTIIIGRMGILMSESAARHGIAFRPFTPPRAITAAALLPPFHGADTRANRGIGFAFAGPDGHRYALAQWPANGGSIARFPPLDRPPLQCPDARGFSGGTTPNGIVWTTTRGLIMTLQADGANDARTLETEWKKLIRRGACR